MPVTVDNVFDGILAAVTTQLASASQMSAINVKREKQGIKFNTDVLPCAYVYGGISRPASDIWTNLVLGNVKFKEYQVLVTVIYAGNLLYGVNQGQIPDITETVQKLLHVPDNFSSATDVWASREGDVQKEYDDALMKAGYDAATVEMWFLTAESQS